MYYFHIFYLLKFVIILFIVIICIGGHLFFSRSFFSSLALVRFFIVGIRLNVGGLCVGVDFGIDRFAFLVGIFMSIFAIFGVLVVSLCLEVWLCLP